MTKLPPQADISECGQNAYRSFQDRVDTWAGDLKSAIRFVPTPHIPNAPQWLSALAWFNVGVGGAEVLLDAAGAASASLAPPIWVINAASLAFQQAYANAAHWTNLELDRRYGGAQEHYIGMVDQVKDQFHRSQVGKALIGTLAEMLQRPEAVQYIVAQESNKNIATQQTSSHKLHLPQGAGAPAFADTVIRRAQIFPESQSLDRWAGKSFGQVLERIKTLTLNSSVDRNPWKSLNISPERGVIYIDNATGKSQFANMGTLRQICQEHMYDTTGEAFACIKSTNGRVIDKRGDFVYLMEHAWLYRIRQRPHPRNALVSDVEVMPLKNEGQRMLGLSDAMHHVPAAKQALERGYQAVISDPNAL